MAQPAGWYEDPRDRRRLRYWDGEAWTTRVRQPETSPTPPPAEGARGRSQPSATPAALRPATSAEPSKRWIGIVAAVVLAVAAGVGGYFLASSGGDTPVVGGIASSQDDEENEEATDDDETEDAPDAPAAADRASSPSATSEATPSEASLLPAVRAGGVQPAATNVITYSNVEDLGFTATSLAAASADIDSDLGLGWVVAPDRQRLCLVSTIMSGPPQTTVGPCHVPVLPDPDSQLCDDMRMLFVTYRDGDQASLAGTTGVLSRQVEDSILGDRLAEVATMLPSADALGETYVVLTFELADLYCGALQRTSTRVPDTLDADGAQYDLGQIVSATPQPDGTVVIEFDRYGYIRPDSQTVDGRDITMFPLIYTITDVLWTNVNPQLRSFVVAETALFYTMDPYPGVCDETDQPAPTWSRTTLDELIGYQGHPAAMRYDQNGLVTEIGRGTGC